jgi:peptide-methionine (R)-S-oxide reductase
MVAMFESDLDRDHASRKVRRRAFLGTSLTAIAATMLWSLRKPKLLEASRPMAAPADVTIVEFSDDGRRVSKVTIPRVVKTEEDWRKQLSPNAFDITRHADTEFAFSGEYWNLRDKGLYRCI